MTRAGVLSGPDPCAGAESYRDHVRRLGPLPQGGAGLLDALDASALLGRGGAAFPVGAKWRAVVSRSGGRAVVVANGAEGEPLSRKDRALMAARPHLVLDGAFLAAAATDAREIVLYIGEDHARARSSMVRALRDRPEAQRFGIRFASAPARYVSGEESAAVHFLNEGVATPTSKPPRPFEHGVGGQPTLVQNVESLAQAALVARGRYAGSVLLTLAGAVNRPSVIEVGPGTEVGEALELAGGLPERARAVMLGGYFGGWLDAEDAWSLPLEAGTLRAHGSALGCGVVAVLPESACGPCETARVMGYLASESAAQCGPCFFGLRSLAEASARVAGGVPDPGDLARLERWSQEVRGRGACRHPDGAAGFMQSALRVFAAEYSGHRAHTEAAREVA